jgi:hypothetical protein
MPDMSLAEFITHIAHVIEEIEHENTRNIKHLRKPLSYLRKKPKKKSATIKMPHPHSSAGLNLPTRQRTIALTKASRKMNLDCAPAKCGKASNT